MSVIRQYVMRHDEGHLKELDKRGILSGKDVFCSSCGEVFPDNDLIHSKYRTTGGKGQKFVKRHLICAIFHNVVTLTEAQKDIKEIACLVKPLVEHQEEKLAEKRRKFFSLKVGAVAMAWAFMILSVLPNINV